MSTLSVAQLTIYEQLPPDAAKLYQQAAEATGAGRVDLLRQVQDTIDVGRSGMLGVYGAVQLELVEALRLIEVQS